jgi:hypothetical protein
MSQEPLDFGRLYRVADGTRSVYRALNDAVDSIGVLAAAGACGIDRGDLRRSLDRDGRRIAVEHAIAIAAIADYDAGRRIIEPIVETVGFAITDDLPRLTDRQRADRLEGALRALGPIGEQALRGALGGRR